MNDGNYGYWTWNGDKNGLIGGPSTVEVTPDGRYVTVKDPELPAYLSDLDILYALSHVRQARSDFIRLFPALDPVSQERLTNLLATNPYQARLVIDDQAWTDALQKREVTAGVRTR